MLLRIYNKHYVAGSWPALFQEHFFAKKTLFQEHLAASYCSFPRAFTCFLLLFSKSYCVQLLGLPALVGDKYALYILFRVFRV